MSERDDAFIFGRLIGEEVIEKEMSSVEAAERYQEVFEQLDARTGSGSNTEILKEFSRGYLHTINNQDEPNFRPVPELARVRALRWLRGERQPEQAQASILMEQTTADKIHKIHEFLPAASLDTMILLALDFLTDQIELETGESIAEYHISVCREQLQELIREAGSGG